MGSDECSGRAVLRQSLTDERRRVAGASALAAGHQAGEALVPVLIGVVIDRAIATGAVPSLVGWLGLLAAVFVGLSFSFRFALRAAERAAERVAHELRLRLTRRVLDPQGGAEKERLPGELVNIATGDAKRVGAVAGTLPFGVAAVAALLVSGVLLLRISLPLGLLILLGVPPVLWLTHLLGKPLEQRSEGEQERAARASGVAADLIAGLRVLKGLGAERTAVDRYRGTSQESRAAAVRATRAHGWHDGAVVAVTGVFLALVALVGAYLAMRGAISIGQLVAAVGLAQFLLTPFQVLTWVNGEVAQGRASAGRIAAVLATPPAVPNGSRDLADTPRGELRLAAVTAGRVRDFDLEVPAGGLVGVAITDSGVATDLLALLARTANPESGAVRLDGEDLSTLDITAARRAVLVADHDAHLFEETVAENVLAGGAAGHERAMAAATVDQVAQTLPDGTGTVLAERGSSLSGGQRQRVALARALAADPAVLVLHDPTTAVDPVTEARIADGIAELRAGRTTVLVTTSPALLATTDMVHLVDGGRIVAAGTHHELAAANADYRSVVLT